MTNKPLDCAGTSGPAKPERLREIICMWAIAESFPQEVHAEAMGIIADLETRASPSDDVMEAVRVMAEALRQYTGVVSSKNNPDSFSVEVQDEGFHAREALSHPSVRKILQGEG